MATDTCLCANICVSNVLIDLAEIEVMYFSFEDDFAGSFARSLDGMMHVNFQVTPILIYYNYFFLLSFNFFKTCSLFYSLFFEIRFTGIGEMIARVEKYLVD